MEAVGQATDEDVPAMIFVDTSWMFSIGRSDGSAHRGASSVADQLCRSQDLDARATRSPLARWFRPLHLSSDDQCTRHANTVPVHLLTISKNKVFEANEVLLNVMFSKQNGGNHLQPLFCLQSNHNLSNVMH